MHATVGDQIIIHGAHVDEHGPEGEIIRHPQPRRRAALPPANGRTWARRLAVSRTPRIPGPGPGDGQAWTVFLAGTGVTFDPDGHPPPPLAW